MGGGVLPRPRHSNVMFFEDEDEVDADRSSRPFYERIELVVPMFVCAVSAFVLCVGVIICCRRKQALMRMKTARQALAIKISQVCVSGLCTCVRDYQRLCMLSV